jgi:[ribosomal protein S18]-alanine N-acetyltransferase
LTSTITIRPATPGDIPAMLAIEAQSPGAGHWQAGNYARIFEPDSVRRVVLVADDLAKKSEPWSSGRASSERLGVEIVGFVVAQCLGTEWEIENVAVVAEARRHGVGQRLVSEVIALARNQYAEAVYLEVRESNAAARSLYGKLGFIETGRRRGYYSAPEEDAVICSFCFPALLKNAGTL